MMPYLFELCFYVSFLAASEVRFSPVEILLSPKRKSDFIRLLLIGLFIIAIGYATILRLNVTSME